MTGWRPSLTGRNRVGFRIATALATVLVAGLALAPVLGAAETETEGETGWWAGLTLANKVFFCIAFFFSVLFLWQFIMTVIGLAGSGGDAEFEAHADMGGDTADVGGEAGDADVGHDFDAGGHADDLGGHEVGHADDVGSHDTAVSFKLLSFRSVIAGGTLFGWAGALYLYNGVQLSTTLLYALAWAFGGALVVAVLMNLMRRLQETGNPRLATCVGEPGTVYMNIPAGGTGKVRTVVSGAVSFVSARAADGRPLEAGTSVKVKRLLDSSTIEVEAIDG